MAETCAGIVYCTPVSLVERRWKHALQIFTITLSKST